jgi:hypothetical protein
MVKAISPFNFLEEQRERNLSYRSDRLNYAFSHEISKSSNPGAMAFLDMEKSKTVSDNSVIIMICATKRSLCI